MKVNEVNPTRYEEVRELVKNDALKITDIAKQTGYNKGHISRLRKESKHQRDIQENINHILKDIGFPVENYSLLISKENWPVVKLFFAALWDLGLVEGRLAGRKESQLPKVIADAVAAEREACAALLDAAVENFTSISLQVNDEDGIVMEHANTCNYLAAAIRARGQA